MDFRTNGSAAGARSSTDPDDDPPAGRGRGSRRAFRPGDPIAVDLGLGPLGLMPVTHVGIVSRVESDGSTWVVSSSFRRRRCQEETLEEFACGGMPYLHDLAQHVDRDEAVRRARSLVGAPWNLLFANCEHVTSWCSGHEPHSPQLRAWGRLAGRALAWTVGTVVTIAVRRRASRGRA
jgi:hypothetical protein